MDFLEHVVAESSGFRAAIDRADPGARVPTCPDWNADDLLWHLTGVQHFWGTIVDRQLSDPDDVTPLERPTGRGRLLEAFDRAHALLVDSLERTADDVPVWTWAASNRDVGFVRRRQAHEAAIHRVDAELIAGNAVDMDAELATDGIAEVFEHMFGGAPPWASHTRRGRIGRMTTTDTDVEWLLQLGRWSGTSPNTGTTYTDDGMVDVIEAGVPTFEIAGGASDLDRWLWNRPTAGTVERRGDITSLEAIIADGVQ